MRRIAISVSLVVWALCATLVAFWVASTPPSQGSIDLGKGINLLVGLALLSPLGLTTYLNTLGERWDLLRILTLVPLIAAVLGLTSGILFFWGNIAQ